MSRHLIAAGLLSLGLMAGANPGLAVNTLPTSGTPTVSYNFGSWTVQISNCGLTLAAVSQNGNCSSEQVLGTVNANGSLSLTYEGASGGALLPSAAANVQSDLSFTETVTAPSGVKISSVFEHVTGTASSAPDLAFDTSQMAVLTPASGQVTANASPLDKTIILAAAANQAVVSKDIHAGSISLSGSNTLALNTVSQTFSVVPEPGSLSLLMAGIGGLIGLRRRTRGR